MLREARGADGRDACRGRRLGFTRPRKATIRGLDLQGNEKIIRTEELLARVFCHEIDHLNGKLFIERLSPLKRVLIKKFLKKRRGRDAVL